MNKKFSTLLAGFALTASVASAAVFTPQPAKNVLKLDAAALKGMYQLYASDGRALAMSDQDSLLLVTNVDSLGVTSTLWCVSVTEENSGKAPIFDFVNKKTGKFLAVSASVADTLQLSTGMSKPIIAGTNYQGWAWSKTYKTSLETTKPMFTYTEADSVVALVVSGNNIALKKYAASAIITEGAASGIGFTLKSAAEVILTADDINAYLKDNENVLNFAPDYKGDLKNPFTTTAFKVDSVNKYQAAVKPADHKYMLIKPLADTDSSYLRVDTASNDTGVRFNKFAWTKPSSDDKYKGFAVDSILSSNSILANQHKFMFIYRPSVDSLFIRVQEARFMPDDPTITSWTDSNVELRKEATSISHANDSLWIKLQNFPGTDTKIVTVGKLPINTKISFNVTSCVPTGDNNTSIPDGLYYIKNNKGQYLTSPLYKNAKTGDDKSWQWVTVDTDLQDVAHMPAFQWVVLKDWTNDNLKDKSPISIYNREFADAKNMANASAKSIQLTQAEGAAKYATKVASILGLSVDSLTFDAVPAESVKDSLLGYKNIPASDLLVYKYKFNYLHGYNADKFVAKNEKDSILNAKTETGTQFRILDGKIAKYGYDVNDALRKRIPGIKPLFRTEYRVILGTDTLVTDKNEFMAVGAANYANNPYTTSAVDSFYFKENNHFNDLHFYAIVRSFADSIGNGTYKVGVTDDGLQLKYQPLSETRTSAFAIERDETPLYRRFNNVALGESKTDGADTLRFVESVRKEYLMDENNREGGLMHKDVNYLGIWTKDKATGLGFRIDTAWVTRGQGYVKPQYLISVDRHDFAGKDGKACTEAGPHFDKDGKETTADKCVHATKSTPAFEYGKYLVSFADSVSATKDKVKDLPYLDVAKGYIRAGFVKAVRYGDKLYILVNQFANMKPEDLTIAAMDEAYKADALKKYIVDLTGDKHKNCTWSFRYVHPEDAANVTKEDVSTNSFLIESKGFDAGTGNTIEIAPEYAAWIKMQNGCIVLTDETSSFSNAKTGGDGALIFNVENKANDELATDNETVTTSEVSVIAGNGSVRIVNAEGKKVVISNILGQVIVNTVISSSDATIAVPQGVVVVAVEGEEAVKAIVK